jgi:hypothetical protein
LSAIIIEVYDPAIGTTRKLQMYKSRGQLVVTPLPPQNTPGGSTSRVTEARLAFSEGARQARGSRGFIGDLPSAPAIIGATSRELMQQARSPRRDSRRTQQKYWASLVDPAALDRAARSLGAPRPKPVPSTAEILEETSVPGPGARFQRLRPGAVAVAGELSPREERSQIPGAGARRGRG